MPQPPGIFKLIFSRRSMRAPWPPPLHLSDRPHFSMPLRRQSQPAHGGHPNAVVEFQTLRGPGFNHRKPWQCLSPDHAPGRTRLTKNGFAESRRKTHQTPKKQSRSGSTARALDKTPKPNRARDQHQQRGLGCFHVRYAKGDARTSFILSSTDRSGCSTLASALGCSVRWPRRAIA